MKKIENIAIDTYLSHKETFRDLKSKWKELFDVYRNEDREGSITHSTKSNTKLGQGFSLVENFQSRVIAQSPQYHYQPRERADVEAVEEYEKFNDYQHEEAKSKDVYEEIAKWAAITGLAGYKKRWHKEQILYKKKGKEVMGKLITNPNAVEMMDKLHIGKTITVDDNETISTWKIDAISPFDLIWNKEATCRDDARVLGHLVHDKNYQDLKASGYNVRKLAEGMQKEEEYWKEQLKEYKDNDVTNIDIVKNHKYTLAELYVKHQNDNGLFEYYICTLAIFSEAHRPIAIRCEKNKFDKQFCPVGVFRPITIPGKFYGIGILEMTKDILNAEEDTFNMNLEASWLDVSRPMEYVPNNVLDQNAVQFRPGTLIPVKNLGESVAVMPTPSPNAGTASFMLGFLERTKEKTSAITEFQTGVGGTTDKTATEFQGKMFMSEQRTNKILKRFESEVLEVSGKMALWMNQQYLKDNKKMMYRVLGKKGSVLEKSIKGKSIEAIKDVVIVSGSTAFVNRQNEIARWQSLLMASYQEAQMGPQGIPIDREYIWMRLLEDGYNIKDSENVLPSLKEREEADVASKQKQLLKAKEENLDPANARVLPTDDHEIHIKLHQAAMRNGGTPEAKYTPEQQHMMAEHLNKHTEMAGGANPTFATTMEEVASQRIRGGGEQQQQTNQPRQQV